MTTIQNIPFSVDFSPSCIAMVAYVVGSAGLLIVKHYIGKRTLVIREETVDL